MEDILNFVFEKYKTEISEFLQTENVSISFYSDSEMYADTIIPDKKNILKYDNFKVKIVQSFSINNDKYVHDINYCTIDNMKFLKIVTPFTLDKAYDFIMAKSSELEDIIKALSIKASKKNFKYHKSPIIGFDFNEIENETIKFLLNEDFRKYCEKKFIKLKRGVVLQGLPGTGKTLTLQYLRKEAEKHKIFYRQFKSIDDFLQSADYYYSNEKKIFVFEDFDAALLERKETNNTANQILGKILNTLEGVEEVNNVVSIFTTNNIEMFDSAFLRPGRIDKIFNYNLPDESNIREFLEAYINEEKIFFDDIINYLENINANISYAVLKGICDDINIYKFNDRKIDYSTIIDIIDEKTSIVNKNKLNMTSEFII